MPEISIEAARELPLIEVAGLLRFVRYLSQLGAPWQRFLQQAHIPVRLMEQPEAVLPLNLALRFGEIACRSEGLPHLGLLVGQQTSLDDLGPYGAILQDSLTVQEYLHKGMELMGMLSSGERFWTVPTGDELQFHYFTPGESDIGKQQAALNALIIVINRLREVTGPGWTPGTLSLAHGIQEKLPECAELAGTQIVSGAGSSFFTMPKTMLALPFRNQHTREMMAGYGIDSDPAKFPRDFLGSVRLTIETLLPYGYPHIDLIAEAAGFSSRTLQRTLAQHNLSYVELVNDTRVRLAADWLEQGDMPVTEIAFALGYGDPSNFTRAFRRKCGVSPRSYRASFKEHQAADVNRPVL